MFSTLGQWIQSFSKRILTENNLSQVNFEDIQFILRNLPSFRESLRQNKDIEFDWRKLEPLFITTIPLTFMGAMNVIKGELPLIEGTLPPEREEVYINELLDTLDDEAMGELLIIIYGQNAMDKTVVEKARQFHALGFSNVCIYSGGMFEWCLLQDIYGKDEFPIMGKLMEPLFYKGKRLFTEG
jgi:hypothetical protein